MEKPLVEVEEVK